MAPPDQIKFVLLHVFMANGDITVRYQSGQTNGLKCIWFKHIYMSLKYIFSCIKSISTSNKHIIFGIYLNEFECMKIYAKWILPGVINCFWDITVISLFALIMCAKHQTNHIMPTSKCIWLEMHLNLFVCRLFDTKYFVGISNLNNAIIWNDI